MLVNILLPYTNLVLSIKLHIEVDNITNTILVLKKPLKRQHREGVWSISESSRRGNQQ